MAPQLTREHYHDYAEPYENSYMEIRKSLAPQYRHLPTEYIEQIIEQSFGEGVSPEDVEGFFSDIGKFAKKAGKTIAKAAPAILPVAGTVVGTALGGPVGAAVGGALGSAAGGAIGSAMKGKKPSVSGIAGSVATGLGGALPGPAGAILGKAGAALSGKTPGGIVGALPGIAGVAGSALKGKLSAGGSAAQLLKLLTQPKVMQSLQAMSLGQAGKQSIPVAGAQVPVSAFANLIGTLANQAIAEQHALGLYEAESIPSYLLNAEGELVVDPAVPEQRATALLSLLQQESLIETLREQKRNRQMPVENQEDFDEMDHYYDYLELLSLQQDLETEVDY